MASLTPEERHDYPILLDRMGFTLVNYLDPVDHSESAVLDLNQAIGLMKHYEAALLKAVETRPIRVEWPAPYLLVEEGDRTYEIVGVYATFEEADTAAGRTQDPSHLGQPWTWYRIHQMVGRKVVRGWQFSVEKQAWEIHYWDDDRNEWISD